MRMVVLLAVIAAGCSSSPTAPTAAPPVSTTPPATIPDLVTKPAFPPLNDPNFDLAFYRQLVHNGYESPNALRPLARQPEAPRIYLRTTDDAGRAIDTRTIDQTAAALINTTGSLTGVFGLAGLEYSSTGTRQGQRGWITVRWAAAPLLENGKPVCGEAAVGGDLITLYPYSGCSCDGGPAVTLAAVKHELGHALGFWHTDSRNDLMFQGSGACDKNPSAREKYHAAIAYWMPLNSAAP